MNCKSIDPSSEKQEAAPDHEELAKSGYEVGDSVFVKPPEARCTTRWRQGTVTGVNSATNVDVDGMPRHIADLRLVPDLDGVEDQDEQSGEDEQPAIDNVRAGRNVRPPDRYGNNIYDV